jgi:glycosyltransferase involved in cell wall biosynthesis
MNYPVNQPFVSVIIIFLNEERFIEEAIESVFAQTYPNWELLLVDDGSSDESSQIARQYAVSNPGKVIYLEHEGHRNLGMSASRNLGLRNARGEFLAFLDGDDVWMPEKLELQVEILQSHPTAAMAYGPLLRWYNWAGYPGQSRQDDLFGVGQSGVHPYLNRLVDPPDLLALFLEDEYFIPGGIMIKRKVLEEVGGFEVDFRGMYEDAVVMVKVCLQWPVFVSNDVTYRYRMHPNSSTHVSWLQGQDYAFEMKYLRWVEAYLKRQNVQKSGLWKAFRKARLRCRLQRITGLFEILRHPFRYAERLKKAERIDRSHSIEEKGS